MVSNEREIQLQHHWVHVYSSNLTNINKNAPISLNKKDDSHPCIYLTVKRVAHLALEETAIHKASIKGLLHSFYMSKWICS